MNSKSQISFPYRMLVMLAGFWLVCAGALTGQVLDADPEQRELHAENRTDDAGEEESERLPVAERCYLSVHQASAPVAQVSFLANVFLPSEYAEEVTLTVQVVAEWVKFFGNFLETLFEHIISTNAP